MNVLVIGQGGREHALIKALQSSASVGVRKTSQVHALPGSDGIAQDARCHAVNWQDFDAVASLVKAEAIELVVIGPEVPLVGGLSDALRAQGVKVFGPSGTAAQLEGSKIFSKEFLNESGVKTARSYVVSSVDEAMKAARNFAPPYVLKADGLAAGKGVFICADEKELSEASHAIFNEHLLGDAGAEALIEEFQPGYEISYLVLTNGEDFEPLVLAQDNKRLRDGDLGPNTGGMGVVAPVEIDAALREQIDNEIVRPTIAHLKKRKMLYRGVLYIGLMITPSGPSVIEFNVRFGDPEAQAILPLLDGDWGDVFREVADGRVPKLQWKKASSCCLVLAAPGYPDAPVKDVPIQFSKTSGIAGYLLHAGTRKDPNKGWVTAGGRVINIVGLGETLTQAVRNAYEQSEGVNWQGMQLRRDIGAKLLTSSSEG